MKSRKVTLTSEALQQIMAVYEGQVPPNPPIEHSQEPDGKGSIAADDLDRVLAVVAPVWDVTTFGIWPINEAKKALEVSDE